MIFIGTRLFLTPVSSLTYIIWNVIQPVYIPIVGVAGLIGKYTWKQIELAIILGLISQVQLKGRPQTVETNF